MFLFCFLFFWHSVATLAFDTPARHLYLTYVTVGVERCWIGGYYVLVLSFCILIMQATVWSGTNTCDSVGEVFWAHSQSDFLRTYVLLACYVSGLRRKGFRFTDIVDIYTR